MDDKKCENKCLKQLIITNNIISINGLKAVCFISVKSRRLSRNNASCGRYTHAQKQCEKGILRVSKSSYFQSLNVYRKKMNQMSTVIKKYIKILTVS